MAYEIAYDLSGQMKKIPQWKKRLQYLGCTVLVIGVIVMMLWIGGGDWAVTVSALDGLVADLGQGSGLQEAFAGFCLDILQGVQNG